MHLVGDEDQKTALKLLFQVLRVVLRKAASGSATQTTSGVAVDLCYVYQKHEVNE